VNQRTTSSLLLAGAWCGVAAWFKHDVAFHVTAGITAGLIAAWLVLPAARRSEWMSPLGVLLRVPGAAFLTLLPVMVLLVGTAWPDVWNALIVFPATDFRIVRGQAYPPLLPRWSWVAGWLADPGDPARLAGLFRTLATWIKGNVIQLIYLTALLVLIRQRRAIDARALGLSLVALAAMPFFWASAHVQHNTHFHSLWLLSMLLGALVWRHAPPATALRRFATVLLVLFGGALLEVPARLAATALYHWPAHRVLEVPSAAGVRLAGPEYAVYQPIASFIRTHVPDTEPIYVGLLRHDAVVISNQAFYYLAGRPVASRYNELHPGITDREDVQREIIGDLNRLGVRCAVLWKFGWPADRMDRILAERRRHLPELGATLLDEYFRREFREIDRFGEYILMWRRDAPLMESVTRR